MLSDRLVSSFFLLATLAVAVGVSYQPWLCAVPVLLSLLLVWAGLSEFHRMFRSRGMVADMRPSLAAGTVLIAGVGLCAVLKKWRHVPAGADYETLVFAAGVLLLLLYQFREFLAGRSVLTYLAVSLAAYIYVAWLFSFLVRILYFPGPELDGRLALLALILISKVGDVLAYTVGTSLGRRKICPSISPKKTVEGTTAGLAGSALSAAGLAHVLQVSVPAAMLLGVALGTASQLGDWCESMAKRESSVKDSGSILPGIGGVLDLLDGLLLSAPVMYLFLVWRY